MKEWIWGRNPIYEALKANRRQFYELRVAKGTQEEGRLAEILQLAKTNSLPISQVPRDALVSFGSNHQGVALQVNAYPYVDIQQIVKNAKTSGDPLLVLLLDTLKDPQNLGTLIRTAEAVGVHGIVLPFRRTATVTPAVVSASSGASEHMLITQANLAQILAQLKEEGAWVVGLEGGDGSQTPDQVDLSGPLAVVVGSEAEGMRQLVRSACDFLLALPMKGKVDSLNAAVAGSIALYLIWQARGFQGPRS
ncbi:MAG: 23S rRNA (guanosine(2251)-2'-O)-methyltransferase RlmB [Anaerolineales bacterium]|nr:23S rRNA (guanosine(2251)-2'-O)-methyltransferase RlmB [Anaerolineales bacterium]